MDRGTLVDHDGRPAVRFRRAYPHPPERVWSAITEPGELERWFPASVSMEHHVGGAVEFTGDPHVDTRTGEVLVFDPPHRLAFTWGPDELHFQIDPAEDGGCVLALVDVLAARDEAARNAAGWAVCLAELDKRLAGAEAHGPHSATAESWQRHYDEYVAAGMPTGAPIPGGGA